MAKIDGNLQTVLTVGEAQSVINRLAEAKEALELFKEIAEDFLPSDEEGWDYYLAAVQRIEEASETFNGSVAAWPIMDTPREI